MEERGDRIILTLEVSDDSGESSGWVDEAEAEGWMGSLVSLRADIMNGDLRASYLAWLCGVQMNGIGAADDEDDEFDDGEDFPTRATVEPPVPPGLRTLTASLSSLVAFLDLDEDLVAVAADRSVPLEAIEPSLHDLEGWVRTLPPDERVAILGRLLKGEHQLRAELLRRFREEHAPRGRSSNEAPRRTIGELIDATRVRRTERERKAAEAAAQGRALRAQQEALALEQRLNSLAGQEHAAWLQVEALIDSKQQTAYDEAVALLRDLADLAQREGDTTAFDSQLRELRARHRPKTSLTRRLNEAGLNS